MILSRNKTVVEYCNMSIHKGKRKALSGGVGAVLALIGTNEK